jgi:hypothetical protein
MDVIVDLADPTLAPKIPNATSTLSWLAVKDIVQIANYFELEFKVLYCDEWPYAQRCRTKRPHMHSLLPQLMNFEQRWAQIV